GAGITAGVFYREARVNRDQAAAETARAESLAASLAERDAERLRRIDVPAAPPTRPVTAAPKSPEVPAALIAGRLLDLLDRGGPTAASTFGATLDAVEQRLDGSTGIDVDQELTDRIDLARLNRMIGRVDKSVVLAQDAQGLAAAKLGPNHPLTLIAATERAISMMSAGAPDEAADVLADQAARAERTLGAGHPVTITIAARLALARAAATAVDDPAALAGLKAAHDVMTTTPGLDERLQLLVQQELGRRMTGPEQAAGVTLLREALATATTRFGRQDPRTVAIAADLGERLVHTGDPGGGATLLRGVMNAQRARLGEDHPETIHTMMVLSEALRRSGEAREAADLLGRATDALERLKGATAPDVRAARLRQGSWLVEDGRLLEAETMLRRTHEGLRDTLGPTHPDTMATVELLVRVLDDRQQSTLASEYRKLLPAGTPEK
ncbi:MAG: tetratricopeptide repeat protein, partial [Phycisphaerales bacterium]|nr:tetratricopeptide repeat protein [Phycisphaerales bacterium]